MLERTVISLVVVLFFMAASVVFWTEPIYLGIALLVAFAIIAATWTIKRPTHSAITGHSGDADEMDAKAGQLIAGLQKGNTKEDVEKIGTQAQKLIVATRKDINSGKIKGAKKAVEALEKRPLPKDAKEKKLAMLATSLACTYLLAEEQGEVGEQTVGRVNNFIASLQDKSLEKDKSGGKKKSGAKKKK